MAVSRRTLTVLTPCFNEVANVGVLAERVAAALADQSVDYRQRQRDGRLETEGDKVDGGRWIRFRSFQQKGGNFNELKTGDTAEILGIKRRYVIAIMKGGRGDLEVVRTNHGPRGL